MQRYRQAQRIVTVCVTGRPARQVAHNSRRFELMVKVAREIRRRGWSAIDALLFPAGYVRSDHWFGPLTPEMRMEVVDGDEIGDAARHTANQLNDASPGVHVIVGVDTRKTRSGFSGDQMVFAFDAWGPTGSARKVFPVDGDTNGWGRAPYVLIDGDTESPARVIQLPNGAIALLSVCYDAFALSEIAIGPTTKRSALRYFMDPSASWRWREPGDPDGFLSKLAKLIATTRPSLNLVAIHGFERPGGELRWQRHGIAAASAGLSGALTVGAAHYANYLPHNIQSQPLASLNVAKSHLWKGQHRRAELHTAEDGFRTRLTSRDPLEALVRLYTAYE